MSAKKCVLDENKLCDDCGECDYCDLNPFKRCDNCGRCIGSDEEYRELKIDDIVINGSPATERKRHSHSHDDNCCCDCEHEHK